MDPLETDFDGLEEDRLRIEDVEIFGLDKTGFDETVVAEDRERVVADVEPGDLVEVEDEDLEREGEEIDDDSLIESDEVETPVV